MKKVLIIGSIVTVLAAVAWAFIKDTEARNDAERQDNDLNVLEDQCLL